MIFDHSGLDYTPYYKDNVVNASQIALDITLISDLILERTRLDKRTYEPYVLPAVLKYIYNKVEEEVEQNSSTFKSRSSLLSLDIDFNELCKSMA